MLSPKLDESVHCIGNGRVCAYHRGVDIIQAFGPHYGVPSAMRVLMESPCEGFEKYRQPGTAIWSYYLYNEGKKSGEVTDFADPDEPILYRSMSSDLSFSWRIEVIGEFPIHPLPPLFCLEGKCFFGEIPAGYPFYTQSTFHRFPRAAFVTDRPYFFAVYVSKEIQASKESNALVCESACGFLALVFAQSFEELLEHLRMIDSERFSPEQRKRLTRKKWMAFTARRKKNRPPVSDEMERITDDVATLIKAQQSNRGGVLAGYNYHLAYIRDNYGVMRGLLAMGCFDEAKALITYYRNVFKQYGIIRNAQGTDSYAFHVHENDNVEITAYLTLMCLDYREKTKDEKTFRTLIPLIRWCIEKQHLSLRDGMLSFNGDETYIAGGLVPRSVIYHGSMEATMLYHRALTRLLDLYDRDAAILSDMPLSELTHDRDEIAGSFHRHFIRDGRVVCNAPAEMGGNRLPEHRNGVRLCGHGFGVSFRRCDATYVCVECAQEEDTQNCETPFVYYHSYSAVLMAIYVGTTLLSPSVLEKEKRLMLAQYNRTGTLSSEVIPGKMTGYDPGLLLYAISSDGVKETTRIRQRLIALRDATGAYVEYYLHGKPSGTMCRPWESGMNISALIGV